jgi:hypothetical protein
MMLATTENTDRRSSRIDLLPLPAAMAHIASEKREAERAAIVGGSLSNLVPFVLALARLAARRDATAAVGNGRT